MKFFIKTIRYLILPKGFSSILNKSFVYFIPYFIFGASLGVLNVIFLFFIFEFIIGPSRYQINDFLDYELDSSRGYHWARPVNLSNRNMVLCFAIFRFIVGCIILVFLNLYLVYVAMFFLISQLFYDFILKKKYPLASAINIAAVYPARSLVSILGMGVIIDFKVVIFLMIVLFYYIYMSLQWRYYESIFIFHKRIAKKPGTDYFYNLKIRPFSYINIWLILSFLFVFLNIYFNVSVHRSLALLSICLIVLASVHFYLQYIIGLVSKQFINLILILLILFMIRNNLFLVCLFMALSTILLYYYNSYYVKSFALKYFRNKYYG